MLTRRFWEDPFDVTHATTDLVGGGFPEDEIDANQRACGRAFNRLAPLDGTRAAAGNFYNDCFADGAALLIVCTERGHKARITLKTVRRHRRIVRLRQEPYERR